MYIPCLLTLGRLLLTGIALVAEKSLFRLSSPSTHRWPTHHLVADSSNLTIVPHKVMGTCRAIMALNAAIFPNLLPLVPPHHSTSSKVALQTGFNLPIASLSEVTPHNRWFQAQQDLPMVQHTFLTYRSGTLSNSMTWFSLQETVITRPLLVCSNNTTFSVVLINTPPRTLPLCEMLLH
jgi:hypothetical protein